MFGTCEMCKRENMELDKHHLIPRTRHKNKKNKKLFSRNDVNTRLLFVCESCHSQIHRLFTEKELEKYYNTLELLMLHPEIIKFVEWISKKPSSFKICMKKGG